MAFSSVWLTAAAPGYVSDMLFVKLQRKLARIAYPKTQTETERVTRLNQVIPDHDGHLFRQHRAATEMMQRVGLMQRSMGMRFMGVPMTLQKAVTAGTALYYIIYFVVYHYGNIAHCALVADHVQCTA
jgi:hypothetical protein